MDCRLALDSHTHIIDAFRAGDAASSTPTLSLWDTRRSTRTHPSCRSASSRTFSEHRPRAATSPRASCTVEVKLRELKLKLCTGLFAQMDAGQVREVLKRPLALLNPAARSVTRGNFADAAHALVKLSSVEQFALFVMDSAQGLSIPGEHGHTVGVIKHRRVNARAALS